MPSMRTDVVLDHHWEASSHRHKIHVNLIKDGTGKKLFEAGTSIKYMPISVPGRQKSARSNASGLLLHPSIGKMVDESVVIQGHAIRFATVDLGATASEIRKQLLRVVKFPDVSHSSNAEQ